MSHTSHTSLAHTSLVPNAAFTDPAMDRRTFLGTCATACAVTAVAGTVGLGLATPAHAAAFANPALPYPEDGLAPQLSKKQIFYHYNKHAAGYFAKLNKQVAGTPMAKMRIIDIMLATDDGGIYNNAAQAWNHTFYWKCMAKGQGGMPSGAMAKAIDKSFGSYVAFRQEFTETCMAEFGSGWGWVVKDGAGNLAVLSTTDAINPLNQGLTPVLTIDLWEHAYYLDYQNRRKDYVNAFLDDLASWSFANAMYVSEVPFTV